MVNPSPSLVDPTLPLKGEVKVVDSVSSEVDPTLPSKSELQVVNLNSSMVDPILPLKSEVKVVESISSPLDPTLSSESVNIEVVALTKSSPCSSLTVENEPKPAEVFMLRSDCSRQEEIFSVSTEPSPSSEVISFEWSNLTESRLHSSVPFQIVVNVTARRMLRTIVDE